VPTTAGGVGADTDTALADWGFSADELAGLRKQKVIG
jgi:crotonobetainyl-CoA:carnitine CoA-transferase CaiB-like acyl-CoA transferase